MPNCTNIESAKHRFLTKVTSLRACIAKGRPPKPTPFTTLARKVLQLLSPQWSSFGLAGQTHTLTYVVPWGPPALNERYFGPLVA
jgi:hypothetical protein